MQRFDVERRLEARQVKERLDLGGEGKSPGQHRPVERLDAEPVPRGEQLSRLRVPDREREHAVEARHARRAPLLIRVEDDLGIAPGDELVAARAQLLAQLPEVVDLAVEGHPVAARRVRHRLVARGREVDDREPPVAERRPRAAGVRVGDVDALVVGSAVLDAREHRRDVLAIRDADRSADSAHRLSFWRRARSRCARSPVRSGRPTSCRARATAARRAVRGRGRRWPRRPAR